MMRFLGVLLLRLGLAAEFDCGEEPYLMLEEVLHNNLGGHGPHHGPEGIVYQAVEYYKNMHRIVHVNVHAVSDYVPWDAFGNGLNGRFGVFTQEAGHHVDVVFSFTTVDKKPLNLRTFTISFYDMDRDSEPGKGVEMVIPQQPYTMVYMSNTTQVKKVKLADGNESFQGTQQGSYQDNPVKVVHEKKRDEDRCVAFEFKNVKEVRMRIASTPGVSARTTQFTCLNSFICKVVADSQTDWHQDQHQVLQVGPQDSNQAPIRARTGLLFEYSFPKDLFVGKDLSFQVTRMNGQALPSWLHFNTQSLTLTGTPKQSDRGILNVKVTTVNAGGVEASTSLTLDVGGGPALTRPIPTQHLEPGKDFVYELPKGMFIDTMDGEKLNFKASAQDGRALPQWLHFEEANGRFWGYPPADAHGVLEVWLTAIDSQHFSVTDSFIMILGHGTGKLKYGPDNSAPVVEKHLRRQRFAVGRPWSYQVPADVFVDAEDRHLPMEATLQDGKPLPKWLSFDPASRTFHGTPGKDDGGLIAVKLKAHDSKGKFASENLLLNITGGAAPRAGGLLPLRHFERYPKAVVGRNFHFQIPRIFGRADGTRPSSYSASRSDGRPLPGWLHFDRNTGTFSGMPQPVDTGPLSVEVTGIDSQGSASDNLVIDVVTTDLESVVLRDEFMQKPGSHGFWAMMTCVSLFFFAFVVLLVAVGVFGLKVSIKRRFMRENKDQAPGTLRSVQCCGQTYEDYSTIAKEEVEILDD